MKTFPEALRESRLAAGLSMAELATKTGVGRNYIWKLERGRKPPSAEIARAVAAVFNESPALWLARVPPRRGSALEHALARQEVRALVPLLALLTPAELRAARERAADEILSRMPTGVPVWVRRPAGEVRAGVTDGYCPDCGHPETVRVCMDGVLWWVRLEDILEVLP